MTAANSTYQRIGETSFPIAAGNGTDLEDLDPAGDILLELLAAAITAELGPRWTAAVANTPLVGTDPVETKLPQFPDVDALRQLKVDFPLLAVSRAATSVQVEDYNLDQLKETWRWDVDYILGPLEIGHAAALNAALVMAARAMALTIHDGGHRAYASQDGYAKNVLADGDGCCGFSSIRVVEYNVGPAQLSPDSPRFHACSMTLETVELSDIVAGGIPSMGNYQGTSLELQSGTEQGIKTLVSADSALPLPE